MQVGDLQTGNNYTPRISHRKKGFWARIRLPNLEVWWQERPSREYDFEDKWGLSTVILQGVEQFCRGFEHSNSAGRGNKLHSPDGAPEFHTPGLREKNVTSKRLGQMALK